MTVTWKVDLSNHDWGRGSVDIGSMVRAGVAVIIHKATDGNRFYRDPYFATFAQRARAAGVPVGGSYHVLWDANPEAQVDWWVDTVLAAWPQLASQPSEWLLDCEKFSYNGGAPSIGSINRAANRLRQRVPIAEPLVYAPRWVYGDVSGIDAPIVASSYGDNPAVPYQQAYPGDNSSRWGAYGKTPAVLQYGSRTTVGSQPIVDANAFRGDLARFRALITRGDDDMNAEQDQRLKDVAEWVRAAVTGHHADNEHTVFGDPWDGAPVYGTRGLAELIGGLQQQIAADSAENKAQTVAIGGLVSTLNKLVSGTGGSIDAAPILAAIADVKQAESTAVKALQDANAALSKQVADLTGKLAAAGQAMAGAGSAKAVEAPAADTTDNPSTTA